MGLLFAAATAVDLSFKELALRRSVHIALEKALPSPMPSIKASSVPLETGLFRWAAQSGELSKGKSMMKMGLRS